MSAWLSDGTGGFRAESGLGAFGMAALLGVAQGETYHASTAVMTRRRGRRSGQPPQVAGGPPHFTASAEVGLWVGASRDDALRAMADSSRQGSLRGPV
jgi:hypothetical protein